MSVHTMRLLCRKECDLFPVNENHERISVGKNMAILPIIQVLHDSGGEEVRGVG